MTPLAREFDACNECRLEAGGPGKYRTLTNEEIIGVVEALESKTILDDALWVIRKIRDANYHGDMESLADIRWQLAHNFLENLKC